jgi:hypothetical protein
MDHVWMLAPVFVKRALQDLIVHYVMLLTTVILPAIVCIIIFSVNNEITLTKVTRLYSRIKL